MTTDASIITIALTAILINNFIFSQFLGCCPFLGCSSKVDTAIGMGLAVTFVMGLASAICYIVDIYILVPLNLQFLETLAFILIIASLVQFVEMFLKKAIPSLYSALGIYLPLITTNCAVLGVVLLNVQYGFNFIQSTLYGVFGGVFRRWLGEKTSLLRLGAAFLVPVVLGSILWQSAALSFVYNSKGSFQASLIYFLTTRCIQFAVTLVLDVLLIYLLLRTKVFERMGIWPPVAKDKK